MRRAPTVTGGGAAEGLAADVDGEFSRSDRSLTSSNPACERIGEAGQVLAFALLRGPARPGPASGPMLMVSASPPPARQATGPGVAET